MSRVISRYVNSKVCSLQSGYLAGSASSRATMARLRRLDTAGEASWMSVGEEIFAGLPELSGGEEVERKELESVRTALQLYATLQQSKKAPVAANGDGKVAGPSLAKACRVLVESNRGEGSSGVKRRLASIEAATDFRGVRQGVRTLVKLIRTAKTTAPVQLDFGLLASDLFEMQFEETRGDVFMRWARDFFRFDAGKGQSEGKEANETKESK
jgi:CRISPR system Cascade subunit CasB